MYPSSATDALKLYYTKDGVEYTSTIKENHIREYSDLIKNWKISRKIQNQLERLTSEQLEFIGEHLRFDYEKPVTICPKHSQLVPLEKWNKNKVNHAQCEEQCTEEDIPLSLSKRVGFPDIELEEPENDQYYRLANIFKKDTCIHKLVPLDKAQNFVEQKRENDEDGLQYSLLPINVSIYEAQVFINNSYNRTWYKINTDHLPVDVDKTIIDPRDINTEWNPSDGEFYSIAVYSCAYSNEIKQVYPNSKLPKNSLPK